MVRRLIIDSTRHWVENYHVDGFRFDLMGLTDSVTMEAAYAACAEVNADVLFEGEGWDMYNGSTGVGTDQSYMRSTDNIAVFNDEIRDLLKAGGFHEDDKGFLTGLRNSDTEAIFLNLIGQPQSNYRADDPGDSLAYIAAHDGLTLHDNIALNMGLSDDDPDQRQSLIDRMKIGNFLILTSQSIPFIHAGQERARSKPKLNATAEFMGDFVRNSYDSSDNINEFPWTIDEPAQELVEFTRGLIWLRRNTPALRIGDMDDIDAATTFFEHTNHRAFAYSVEWDSETYVIMVNVDVEPVTFDLGEDVSGATILVDYDEADHEGVAEVTGVTIDGSSVTLDGLTPALLRL
jgi:pullulanase/glycogen debranching enzyme